MSDSEQSPRRRSPRSTAMGLVVAFGVALAAAFGVYLLLEATQPVNGLVSFSFLLILPAAISAFISYVADPWGERSAKAYLLIPFWLLGIIIVASIFILHEGTICVVLLSPLWLSSCVVGSYLTYRLRNRGKEYDKTYSVALLIVPLLAMQIEPMIPLPSADATVERSIVVNATPAEIWPLLRGIPDVRPDEGRWNISQDVIGIPRPLGARLVGDGIGADRLANWGQEIKFRERITEWQPERRIGWRFIFDDLNGWAMTDRHLMPDSPYFRITTGGYRMEPMQDGKTRVTLTTRYTITTPVNAYSSLWGELFLGDIENNLLAVVRDRAERAAQVGQSGQVPLSPRHGT